MIIVIKTVLTTLTKADLNSALAMIIVIQTVLTTLAKANLNSAL